jgi:PST family polysaccharide transporter
VVTEQQAIVAEIAPGPDGVADAVADVERSELKRRSVHGAAATVVAQGIRFVLQFGSQVALARLLVPADFGLVAMVTPVVGFLQIFGDMGLLLATVQKATISQRELSGLFWVNLAVSAALALLVVACSPGVAWFYGEPRAEGVTACLGALLLLGGLSAQPMALMNRTLRFVPLAAIDIAGAVSAAAVGIAAATSGLGYWSLVVMQAANALTVLVLAWVVAGWRPSRPRRVAGIVSLLRFGGHVTAFNVVNYFSYNLDNVLIGATWGEAPLGLYNRGFRLMLVPIMQVVLPFARVAVPLLSRLHDSPEKYRAAYAKMLRAALLATTPGIAFAIVMAHALIVTVLGQRWEAAAPIFAWLGVCALAAPINLSASWLFVSQNRPRQQLGWSCVGTAIMVVAFLVGLPWGVVGVAMATACFVWLLQAPLLWWGVTREGPVRIEDLGRAFYPAFLAGAVSFATLWLAKPALLGMGAVGLPLALAISYVVHVVTLACLPEGNRTLRELWDLRSMFGRGAI